MPKSAEQDAGHHQEHRADDRGDTEADARRHPHALERALGIARAQVLAGDRRRGAHQARPTST